MLEGYRLVRIPDFVIQHNRLRLSVSPRPPKFVSLEGLDEAVHFTRASCDLDAECWQQIQGQKHNIRREAILLTA